jgi:hypothetical protein
MVANKTVITVASNVVLTLASALDMANWRSVGEGGASKGNKP